ncbi:hypothetical protein M0R45_031679 [Rubus argutus]|uniref:Uncharacterized protein n=1 Tax=Rubus argutus TaxID=59490 RepID=A0AAW1WIA8_RUBAR
MVIWNIQMIKRYRNKIPSEIVERIEDEVLDLRKTMGRRSVISEMKSKLDGYLSNWRNDQRLWGSRDHSGRDEVGGYYRDEASWDHSGSDIHTMTKSMEKRFQVTRQEKLRVQLPIWKRQWKEEMLMKLRPSLMMKTKLSQKLGSTCEASKHDPGGSFDAFGCSTKAGGVVERLADAFHGGGFDDFGGGWKINFGGGSESLTPPAATAGS